MQTFSQICSGLGYKSYHAGYEKLSRAGVELANLPRFIGEDKRTVFYDDDTAEYIRSVIKPCNKKYQAAALKRLDAKKVPVKMESQDPVKDKVLKEESEPAASKKKAVTSHKARPNPAVPGFEYRFQQIQVLGSLLNEQISQLSRDMAASRNTATA